MIEALDIRVTGIVQGVGFRPFVYRIAKEHHIFGWVLNAVDGVSIHAEGLSEDLDRFVIALSSQHPVAAKVEEITLDDARVENYDEFIIRFSDSNDTEKTTLVSPDLATCDECVKELFDPKDRRYRYPFINCTNCGPRFTIIDELPYDRPSTSMKEFVMCDACQNEYEDPTDRRFHAQPNACFDCGPHLGFVDCFRGGISVEAPCVEVNGESCDRDAKTHNVDGQARVSAGASAGASDRVFAGTSFSAPTVDSIEWAEHLAESDAFIARTVEILHQGGIVAVKGLGGYHLVCDATNPEALQTLRKRKRREGKAFAVMLSSVEEARQYCLVNQAEEEQLLSPARPIVLLKKKPGVSFAPGLADDLTELGVMLPATPLQHLLMHDFGGMLVMTSGNVHDEPIVTTEDDLFTKLTTIADAFLVHDRAIESRYDDSVVRVLSLEDDCEAQTLGNVQDSKEQASSILQVVRRARGLAPLPVAIPTANDSAGTSASLFATGPEQKNTFTFTRGNEAFVSQHIGDMENAETFDAWLETKQIYSKLFHLEPTTIVSDFHPEYLTTKWAVQESQKGKKHIQVQHHYAHVLSVMGENKLEGPVCGIAFDGTGYGLDGAIWGGEVLLCNLQTYERFANFAYMPLPGGVSAIKHPARCAYGALWATDLLEHPGAQAFLNSLEETSLLDQMIEKGINCPMTSSVGRMFDAVSALLGVCTEPHYEGEAAILLEAILPVQAKQQPLDEAYQIAILKNTATKESTALDTSVLLLDPAPAFEALLSDMQKGTSKALCSKRFHDALIQAIVTIAELVRAMYDINIVTLSGGVFMNRYVMERVLVQLQNKGFTVAINRDLPPNDASISYGQAVLGLHTES